MHTPGPWRAGMFLSNFDWYVCLTSKHGDGNNIVDRVNGLDSDERLANAKLIAAAPDMLDMLIELQECAKYWSEYDVPIGIVDRLNNVIEKATKTNKEPTLPFKEGELVVHLPSGNMYPWAAQYAPDSHRRPTEAEWAVLRGEGR